MAPRGSLPITTRSTPVALASRATASSDRPPDTGG
jgi:hypothetical protein